MTKEQLVKISAIALEIAAWPTEAADRGRSARRTIPRHLIGELRERLENAGVDWRAYREAHPSR